jgi:hypothetical protein
MYSSDMFDGAMKSENVLQLVIATGFQTPQVKFAQ